MLRRASRPDCRETAPLTPRPLPLDAAPQPRPLCTNVRFINCGVGAKLTTSRWARAQRETAPHPLGAHRLQGGDLHASLVDHELAAHDRAHDGVRSQGGRPNLDCDLVPQRVVAEVPFDEQLRDHETVDADADHEPPP